jgi:acyl-CoA thioester hydrolase
METPSVPAADKLRFRVRLATRWSDEDNQNVLNNAIYMTLLEEARYAYFTRLALLHEGHFPFLLAQTNIVFVAPARAGTPIDVEMATVHLGRSSFTQAYRLRDAERGAALCEAEARLVAWDAARGAKCDMPAEFRARIAALERLE